MKWEKLEFNDVLEKIVGGGTPSKTIADYWNGDIPWCSVKDMVGDKFQLYSTEDTITNSGLENSSSNLILAGTVITSTRMGLGRAFINKVDMAINQDLKALLPNERIDNKFLLWTIVNKKEEIEGLGIGSTVKGIRLEVLRGLKFYLPPLPTQCRIASILSSYDDLIENNLKRIKLLEENLMIEYSMLEDESKNLKEYDFSNFVTFVKGIEPGSSNYLIEKSDGTLPFIRVGDLSKRDSGIFIDESKSKGIICNPNDVLISMDGTIGIVKYGIYGCYSSAIRKAVSNGVLNNAFIFCYLSSKKIQGVIYSHSKGSTIQHAGSSINHFKIKIPKETSLNDFIKLSNPIYYLMNNLLQQNTKLREARDILLPRLMSGEIEV
jgi:type I restriction enzyme S subunit